MSPPAADPLALGQKLVSVLDDGLRTATYKLATLIALLDHAAEHVPEDLHSEAHVDLDRRVPCSWGTRQARTLEAAKCCVGPSRQVTSVRPIEASDQI